MTRASTFRVLSGAAIVVLLGSFAGSGRAWAACTVAGTPRICNYNTITIPQFFGDNNTPDVNGLTINGGPDAGNVQDLTDGVLLFNENGDFADLTFTTTGFISATGDAASEGLIEISNGSGLNTVVLGTGFDLDAQDVAYGLLNRSFGIGTSVLPRLSTRFDGILTIASTVESIGVGTEVYTDATTAYTVLGPTAVVTLSGAAESIAVMSYTDVAGANATVELEAGSTVVANGDEVVGVGAIVDSVGAGNATVNAAAGSSVAVVGTDTAAIYAVSGAGNVSVQSAGSVTAQGSEAAAIYATSVAGTVAVQASGNVAAQGDDSAAIFATSDTGSVTVNLSSGTVAATGARAVGIDAEALGAGGGNATVAAAAGSSISATGADAFAIVARSTGGDVSVQSGNLSLQGSNGAALYAQSLAGDATVDARLGAIQTTGTAAKGIEVHGATSLSARSAGITTSGADADALYAQLTGTGSVTVDTTAGALSTSGNGADALFVGAASGTLGVTTGAIQTAGIDAWGVHLDVGAGSINLDTRGGAIQTSGQAGYGVWSFSTSASGHFDIGAVTTTGVEADGVYLDSDAGSITGVIHGPVRVSGSESLGVALYSVPATGNVSGALTLDVLGNVSSTGRHNPGIDAESAFNSVAVNIASGASVMGGWEAQPGDVGLNTNTGGLGVRLSAGPAATATLTNAGILGAWSDRALQTADSGGAVTVTNTGTINGYASLGAVNDLLVNSGQWYLRDFADSDGNGVRDTKRIATVTFGAGNDTLRNEAGGVLRLANVTGATTVVTDRQYLPDLMPVAGYATTTSGVEQAHLTQLERFENRGTITLRDMDSGGTAPVAGDVLLMTSGVLNTAGLLTPGAAPLVFLSDGGALALDVELNQGGAASHADMLVVDSVQLGPNGPTRILVANAGGLGAATVGAGIKLVDVLGGGSLSAQSAFVLGAPVVAGAFTYNLFHSAPLSTDGDWYLRTAPAVTPPPPPVTPPPEPPPTPPPPPPPPPVTYRPEAALFASLPAFLRSVDATAPGSRQARLGDEAGGLSVARRGRAWARYITQDLDIVQQGTVAPASTGKTTGYQVGVELYGGQDEAAAQIGLYTGRLTANATVSGFSNGVANTPVGQIEPEVTYAGVYVSRSRGRGLYFDTVLQYGFYKGEALTFADGKVADIRGSGGYASLEAGYGFAVLKQLVIEPQFQLVAQPQRLHDITIVNARVTHGPANTVAGRAGVRVKGDLGTGRVRFQPYASVSLWRGLDHQDETNFSGNGAVQTTLESAGDVAALELTAGLSVGMGTRFMAFAEYSKLNSGSSAGLARDATTLAGGLRFAW
jgi:hypothetical protein